MRAILLDVGPLYATVIPSDQYHLRARQELERLAREDARLMVSFPTLLEAYGLILRRSSIPVAHSWLAETVANVIFVNPSPNDYHLAGERVRRYADQAISLFDAL